MLNAIQTKNDSFRKAVLLNPQSDGKAIMTREIASLGSMANMYIYRAIANYNDFNEAIDPHNEHDFGVIELANLPKIYWKIDYYEDKTLQYGAEDRLNCYRVLIIMLATDY